MRTFWFTFLFLLPACLVGKVELSDLSLDDAEAISLEFNKCYLMSIKETHEAKARESQSFSRLFPDVTWQGSYNRLEKDGVAEDFTTGAFSFTKNIWTHVLSLDQPLLAMDRYYGYKMQEWESVSSKAERLSSKNDLLLFVRKNYYAVVLYELSLEVQKENIEYLSAALNIEQKAFDAGTAIPYQVNQSKVAVSNAISQYYTTMKNLQNSRNALMESLGVDPIFEKELSVGMDRIPVFDIPTLGLKLQIIKEKYHYEYNKFPSTYDFICHVESIGEQQKASIFQENEVDAYIDIALSNRPELKVREAEIKVADADINKQRSRYLPDISGTVKYQYNQAFPGSEAIFNEKMEFAAGLKFEWTIFDSLFREHKVGEACSKRSRSWLSFQNIRNKIELAIRNQVYMMEEAMLTFVSSSEGVLLAEEAMRDAKSRLIAGTVTPIEYRDTVNSLAQARNQKNFSSYNLLISYYQLRYAMGLDVENSEID